MKLVEILARELEVWPEGVHMLDQASDGYVCRDRYFFLADDWHSAEVTRPQWQSERDRMKAMGTFDKQALHDELRSRQGKRMPMPDCVEPEEPTYEQQLWDRVYEESWKHAMKACDPDHVTQEMFSHMTECAGAIADAFMAERAKRVGK